MLSIKTGRCVVILAAMLISAAMAARAASLTEGEFWIIGSEIAPTENKEFKVSVHPGNSGFAGTGNVGSVSVPVDEKFTNEIHTIHDYAFYTDGGATNVATVYAEGEGELIQPLAPSLHFSTGYFGSPDYGNIWETTDPGVDYSTAPDFSDNTQLGNVTLVEGSIDISTLESGSIYFIYGAYRSSSRFTITMTDIDGLDPDLQLVDVGDDDGANGNECYVYRADFLNDKRHDLILYRFTNSGDDAGRFAGVVVTGEEKPPPGMVIILR